MYSISALYIYPIKSLKGIPLTEVDLCKTGFRLDRRWMLVGDDNRFISQRSSPELTLFNVHLEGDSIIVSLKQDAQNTLRINIEEHSSQKLNVQIWEDTCEAYRVSTEADDWFSERLNRSAKLVYMPDSTNRKVDPEYTVTEDDSTSFADAYPILMISEASLELLNSKLTIPIGFDRFRPNMVVTGMQAHMEDDIASFKINNIEFYGVKPCVRCIMTTIDQKNGVAGKEPLKTLSTYRERNNKIYFGQNVIGPHSGNIKIGDSLQIIKRSCS